jgi:hypothetical protein
MNWINLGQDTEYYRAVVNAEMNILVRECRFLICDAVRLL